MKRIVLFFLFFTCAIRLFALEVVDVEYFFSSGCVSCVTINTEVLPQLKQQCGGKYQLIERELSDESNYLRLVEIQEAVKQQINAPVFIAVNGITLFSGVEAIHKGLVYAVEAAASNSSSSITNVPAAGSKNLLVDRMARFRALGLFIAGTVDGLNPCAISSLIFMLGLLASARVKGSRLAMAGVFFCLSSFITYFLLGLGLLESLKALAAFGYLRLWINRIMALALLLMALLSFRDAFRFKKGGKVEDLSLKLPEFLRNRIKTMARKEIRTQPVIWAAFILGFLVTLIESVCTGQLYVPTLAWMVKTSPVQERAWGLLALYNLGFILPLVGVFVVMLSGSSVFSLLGWQQRHVSRGKMALGFLFLALAVGLVVKW